MPTINETYNDDGTVTRVLIGDDGETASEWTAEVAEDGSVTDPEDGG